MSLKSNQLFSDLALKSCVIKKLIFFFSSEGFISNMSVHRQSFPDEEDEKGAAKALMRLQDTYKLDPESFSKGKLPGQRQYSGNSNSCFHTVFISSKALSPVLR